MVTIKNVGRLAGVSLSTASNALNGKSNVKLETKERVLEIAELYIQKIIRSLINGISF